MSSLQYIGARYVPAFYENPDTGDMTWKSGIGYEPLTVVTYNSDTYTSKIPVPSSVGDPASNPTYWAKTADYNAALVALQNSVNDLVDDVDTINSKFTVFIFDSWGGWPNSDNVPLSTLIPQNMGLAATEYVSYVANGYGFSRSGRQFITELQSHAAELSAVADKVSRIVVLGGANDPYLWSTVLDDIGTFCTYAKATYPNAEICIGHLSTPRADKTAISNWQDNKSLYAYRACGTHGARYLTGVEYICHDSGMFDADMVHPNPYGVKMCAEQVPCAILGGEAHMSNEIQPTATFNSAQTTYSAATLGGSIRELQIDGTCYLEFRQSGHLDVGLTTPGIPASGLGSVKVMTLNKKLIIGDGYNNCAILGMALARTPNANVGYIPCIVAIDDDGDLMITLCIPAMSTIDFSGVTVLNIMLAGRIFAPADKC